MRRASGGSGRDGPAVGGQVCILAVKGRGDSVIFTAEFEGGILHELTRFAREKGFSRIEELISLLFRYGVSEERGVEAEEQPSEVFLMGARYATMRFRAFELFAHNRALTIGLATALQENLRQRRLASERGLAPAKKEEWEGWNQEKVDGLYERYVFVRME
jgi:hypothetical protein